MDVGKLLDRLVDVVGPRIWPIAFGAALLALAVVMWLLNTRIATVQDENHRLQQFNDILQQSAARPEIGDTGIKLTSIRDGDVVDGVFEVSGVYNAIPDGSSLKIFVEHSGGGFFPQDPVEYAPEQKTWRGRVDVGSNSGETVVVIAALVGRNGQILVDYYFKVGAQSSGHWVGLDLLTSDAVEVTRVKVVRK